MLYTILFTDSEIKNLTKTLHKDTISNTTRKALKKQMHWEYDLYNFVKQRFYAQLHSLKSGIQWTNNINVFLYFIAAIFLLLIFEQSSVKSCQMNVKIWSFMNFKNNFCWDGLTCCVWPVPLVLCDFL